MRKLKFKDVKSGPSHASSGQQTQDSKFHRSCCKAYVLFIILFYPHPTSSVVLTWKLPGESQRTKND